MKLFSPPSYLPPKRMGVGLRAITARVSDLADQAIEACGIWLWRIAMGWCHIIRLVMYLKVGRRFGHWTCLFAAV